ncbi:MAG: response regulator transcription factor [Candidatus Omnitrophica bacterium]|nr:response regulator transcription factor [Candidatus Omnitrophota bacterium]MCA9442672.1 response regulator transcription factor [Candidatus Omnitrophota bacterium]
MKVLVVEDSRRLRTYIKAGLEDVGYAVDTADDGEEGLWLAQSNEYDAIVLDLMLPKMDGIQVLQQLRKDGIGTHVLILTAKDTVEDRVVGLEQGADDYLIKPFALEELLARVQALVRRGYGVKSSQIVIGSLFVDTTKRVVKRGGDVIDLTPREFALLEYLCMKQGQVVNRTEIEHHIYDDLVEPMSNVVDTSVYRLRKKIDRPGDPSLIKTRRGQGYVLEEDQQ